MDARPHTSTPGPLRGPQANDLSRVVLRTTVVLTRLYAILEYYFCNHPRFVRDETAHATRMAFGAVSSNFIRLFQNHLWLLKDWLSRNPQKVDRVRMSDKRFPLSVIFLIAEEQETQSFRRT